MEHIDTSNFDYMKPLIKSIYYHLKLKEDNTDIRNYPQEFKYIRNKLYQENLKIYNMCSTLSYLILDTHSDMNIDELDERVYSYFRKFYLMANKQFEELTTKEIEKSKDMIINKPIFNEFDNIILHLSSFNSLFNEIQDLKVSQYQDVFHIYSLLDKTKAILAKTNSKEFKQSMSKYSLITPYINTYIEKIKKDINHYLAKVNDICNDNNMTNGIFKEYQSVTNQMIHNLNLIQKDFTESKSLSESKFTTRNNLGDRSGQRFS